MRHEASEWLPRVHLPPQPRILCARKRAHDAAGEIPSMLQGVRTQQCDMDEHSRLRDLVADAASSPQQVSQLLRGLHQRRADASATNSHPMSEKALSSQELFLSVVMEWQRPTDIAAPTQSDDRPCLQPTQMDAAYASSYVTSPSVEDEMDDHRASFDSAASASFQHARCKDEQDVSPTSVHAIPREPAPLQLNNNSAMPKKIGIYSPRARQELLRRYMAKRARRLSQHKVRYGVRKTLANARPRIKGRFVKTEQPLTAARVAAMDGPK